MSADKTVELIKLTNAVLLQSHIRSRAVQMNLGAAMASGDVLYFLHADTTPPETLFSDIQLAINEGYSAGCFQLIFDYAHWFLRLNAWFSQFNNNAFRYGDQSLFVKTIVFKAITGFNGEFKIFEDNEIILRLKRHYNFKLINKAVMTSARKYNKHGIFRLQFSYYIMYCLYRIGGSQNFLLKTYRFLVGKSW